MSWLLRSLGCDDGDRVLRIVESAWAWGREVPPGLIYAIIAVGFALAMLNWLPWLSLRTSTRLGTFLLRLGMVAILLAAVVGLEWHVKLELGEPQQWTVIVDDSGSMATGDVDGKPRLAAATADVQKLTDSLGDDVQLRVATLSGRQWSETATPQGPTRVAAAIDREALARERADQVILLTDGRDSEARHLASLGEDLKARDIRLAIGLYGSAAAPSDTGITAEPERSILRLGEELIVRGAATGKLAGEQTVTVKEDGKEIKSLTVSPATGGRFSLAYRPKQKGQHVYSFELAGSDALQQNNIATFSATVVEEPINVLLIEGFPRFEFKLIKSVLEVDPLVKLVSVCHVPGGGVYVQGEPLHRNPEQGLIASQSDLFKYDVVILRDLARSYFLAGGDTTESRLRSIVEFVTKRGGGLIVLGGQDVYRAGGYENSHLAEILPFDLSDRISGQPQFEGTFFVDIPRAAMDHPVLRLLPDAAENRARITNLPKLDGSNNVGLLKPLATPLLTRTVQLKSAAGETSEKQTPILGYMAVGEGKVLAGAVDTLWKWQLQPDYEDPPLTMLLANAVRYVAPTPGKKPGTPSVSLADGTPQVGQEITLTTDLKDSNFEPIRGADLLVTVTPPSGQPYHIYPRDLPEEPGQYSYRIAIDEVGQYKVNAKYGKLDSTREFLAGVAAGELADLSVDRAAAEQLAKAAGGRVIQGDIASWARAADRSPARRVAVRDLEVWNSPLALILFVTLVCLDCYLRKRQGLA